VTVSERFSVPALILGAGAWGTALAAHWSKRAQPGQVSLWTRREEHLQELESARLNQRYLPGVPLPDALDLSPELKPALLAFRGRSQCHAHAPGGLIVLACPVAGLSQLAAVVSDTLGPAELGEGLVWLSKGLVEDGDNFYWPSDLVRRAMRTDWPMAAFTGPSFAMEVAKGLPCALTAASTDIDFARRLARICHGGGMRVYASDDLLGAELGGAVKNIMAIAAGVADGLGLGANARAALLTRGLAETARLAVALGARPESMLGLAVLGDLVLTATGDLSRNRRVGLALAKGKRLQEILSGLGHVAEGVNASKAVAGMARRYKVDMPIVRAVCQLLSGEVSAKVILSELLSRDPVDELDASIVDAANSPDPA
jgi:glycerol-3-phosphate dehydrogenase (NAD(P)+)